MSCKVTNSSEYDVSGISDLVHNLYGFANKRFGFQKHPVIDFVSDTANYGVLNKTAHYEPEQMKITIYVDGRHPKDMLRSIAHELIHHMQNEKGQLSGVSTGSGYAQKDDHMRNMEKDAYLQGNMCFRDWEDGVKANNPTIYNEGRIHKMSYNDWRAKQLGQNLLNKWGFKMDLSKLNENQEQPLEEEEELEEGQEELEEGEKPDFLDLDKDGDEEESMKAAGEDAKKKINLEEITMGSGYTSIPPEESEAEFFAQQKAKLADPNVDPSTLSSPQEPSETSLFFQDAKKKLAALDQPIEVKRSMLQKLMDMLK
jgi:hypothetical protein